jgi:hypothetical protein
VFLVRVKTRLKKLPPGLSGCPVLKDGTDAGLVEAVAALRLAVRDAAVVGEGGLQERLRIVGVLVVVVVVLGQI